MAYKNSGEDVFGTDPLFDPFTPQKVYIETPQGLVVDVMGTVKNFGDSSLPEIGGSVMQANDMLALEFDDGLGVQLIVGSVEPKDLTFGTDDLRHPPIDCIKQDGGSVQIWGSCISPAGTMMTPSTVRIGEHLSTSDGVSQGTIKDFTLFRKDVKSGQYGEVHLNKLRQLRDAQPSLSYLGLTAAFQAMTDSMANRGFDFDSQEEREFGGLDYQKFLKASSEELVMAVRQGFGCAIEPQYEVYTYDAPNGILRAMRTIPGQGMAQLAIMALDVEQLVATTIAGNDWQNVSYLGPSNFHRGLGNAPMASFVTYTWQNPSQERPTITIKTAAHGLQDRLENKEGVSIGGPISAEVRINTLGDKPEIQAVNPEWWLNEQVYEQVLSREISVDSTGKNLVCRIGEISIVAPVVPSIEIDEMVAAVARASR